VNLVVLHYLMPQIGELFVILILLAVLFAGGVGLSLSVLVAVASASVNAPQLFKIAMQ